MKHSFYFWALLDNDTICDSMRLLKFGILFLFLHWICVRNSELEIKERTELDESTLHCEINGTLCVCYLLSRQWHQQQAAVMSKGASSAFGMSRKELVEISYPTTRGRCKVLLFPGMIASFYLLVRKILIYPSVIRVPCKYKLDFSHHLI